MFYLTGYSFISTERPAALVVPVRGEIGFLGPLLEKDHVRRETKLIKDVKLYTDYPGERHPIQCFADFLKEMKLGNKHIGIDGMLGATGMWGYKGESLAHKLKEAKFVDMSDLVPSMRLVKSEAEIELVKESARWSNLATELMQRHTKDGLWDIDVAMRAAHEASLEMKKTLGTDYAPTRSSVPIVATYRGQVGEMGAIPHSIATSRLMKKGDVIITEVAADIGGYTCELERTMIIGQASMKQRKYFNVMNDAQRAAYEAMSQGAKCSDVDKASFAVFKKAGLAEFVRHHTGHGLGLDGHEQPWLDVGNDQQLKAGMIVSLEPGIYEAGFAGFRHSDSVLVTREGAEFLTYYPRELDKLTIS